MLYSCIRVYVITNTAPSEHLSMGELKKNEFGHGFSSVSTSE